METSLGDFHKHIVMLSNLIPAKALSRPGHHASPDYSPPTQRPYTPISAVCAGPLDTNLADHGIVDKTSREVFGAFPGAPPVACMRIDDEFSVSDHVPSADGYSVGDSENCHPSTASAPPRNFPDIDLPDKSFFELKAISHSSVYELGRWIWGDTKNGYGGIGPDAIRGNVKSHPSNSRMGDLLISANGGWSSRSKKRIIIRREGPQMSAKSHRRRPCPQD